MLYKIENIYGRVIYAQYADTFKEVVEAAIRAQVNLKYTYLYHADLSDADLSGADLSDADLREANLSSADLSSADLSSADLSIANLRGANLRGADLSSADLSGANLRDANLSGANLSWADIHADDLRGADFRGANLREAIIHDSWHAGLRGTKFDTEPPDSIRVVPKEGEFIGWKKCRYGDIVKLLIPADAKRSNAYSRKCRASKAVVLEVIGAEVGVSSRDYRLEYRVGETVYPDRWDPNWWNECSHGIHFFMTQEEAEKYYFC